MVMSIGVIVAGSCWNWSGVRLFSGIVGGGRVTTGTTVMLGMGREITVPGVAGVTVEMFVGIICTGS